VISMEFSAKTEGWITTGVAVGTGILAWEAAATAKFAPWAKANNVPYGLLTQHRFADALGLTIGYDAAHAIFPSEPCAKGYQTFNLMGAVNKTSMTGVAVLVADAILREVVPEYKKLDGIPSAVKGAGLGLTAGGIIGGVFDPNPSGFTALGQQESGMIATGNVPFGRSSERSQMTVLQ
jgi:hypothetical protein